MKKFMSIPNSPRRTKYYLVFGLLTSILISMLVPINLSHYNSRIVDASWDLGHLFGFIGFAYAGYYFFPRFKSLSLTRQYLIMLLLSGLAGLILETAQLVTGRMASLHDVFLDMMGGMIAVTLFSSVIDTLRFEFAKWGLIVVLFLLSSITLISYLWDGYVIQSEFPVLGDFEKEVEKSRWFSAGDILISRDYASKGQQSLKIKFKPGRYSGAKLRYLFSDWKGYKSFALDIYLPTPEPLKITLSIYSKHGSHTASSYNSRFNKIINLRHGWNKIILPLKEVQRSLPDGENSISNIAGLMVYMINERDPRVVYLDNLRLIKNKSAL